MKITYLPQETQELELGDFIRFNGQLYLVIKAKLRETQVKHSPQIIKYELVSLTGLNVYTHTTFEHLLHILNHVKKHYGNDYVIIKSNKVELKINE